jgi:predicted transcriptional regulator
MFQDLSFLKRMERIIINYPLCRMEAAKIIGISYKTLYDLVRKKRPIEKVSTSTKRKVKTFIETYEEAMKPK